ncbi:MAG TPA: DNA-binding protein [Microvirga sp.]|nr:DNA-binding protein [Microvirga sp.]
MKDPEFVNVRELAELTRISCSHWNKRRLAGNGPPYVKLGRSVRYHWPTVQLWLAARQRRSTSDTARPAQ